MVSAGSTFAECCPCLLLNHCLFCRSLEQDRDRLQRLHQGAIDESEGLKVDAAKKADLYKDALQLREQEAATSSSLQVTPCFRDASRKADSKKCQLGIRSP